MYSIFNLSLALAVYSFETMYLDVKFSILLALFCVSVNFYLLLLGNSQLFNFFQTVLQHYLLECNTEVFLLLFVFWASHTSQAGFELKIHSP